MSDMTLTGAMIKPRILALLSLARERERKIAASLTDEERKEWIAPGEWTPNERFISIMRWRELQAGKLAQAVLGETPPDWRDEALASSINVAALAQYQDTPREELERASERAYQTLVTQIEKLSEDELSDSERFPWAEGAGLWQETLGNGFWYPFTQLVALKLGQGKRECAAGLQEAMLDATRAANLPKLLDVTLYNSACFYALHDWPDKALALLPEAFTLRPTLVEISRHDSDFDTLRDDPRLQAIYDDPAVVAAVAALPPSELVTPTELARALTTPDAPLVIDVRGASEFAVGHVACAINIPLGKLQQNMKTVPLERAVVTYCNMHHRGESRGERAAALLRQRGYWARALDGGFPAWKEEGLAVE